MDLGFPSQPIDHRGQATRYAQATAAGPKSRLFLVFQLNFALSPSRFRADTRPWHRVAGGRLNVGVGEQVKVPSREATPFVANGNRAKHWVESGSFDSLPRGQKKFF
jgi:hypothetical protein